MIYYHMNLIFAVNLFMTAAWLPIYKTNTLWGFIVGWVLIMLQMMTGCALMTISDRSVVYWPEVFLVRLPFSLYTGWITAASILGTSQMPKSWGASDPASIRPKPE